MPKYETEAEGGHREGITLVELVIVLACLSILLTAAIPGFNRLRRQWLLLGSVRLLEASLQWGRGHAITANTSLMLVVDQEGQRFYWVDAYAMERYENTIRLLPAQVRIVSSPRRPLRFYQKGNAAPAGTFIVEGETGIYRIIVNLGGRIRIERE